MRRLQSATFAVLCLVFAFAWGAVAAASEGNDAFPGVPMGIGGVTGVIDENTDPTDIYAVRLFEGQQVTFTVTRTDSTSESKYLTVALYGPSATSTDEQALERKYMESLTTGKSVSISYTPASSDVYYLAMMSINSYFGPYGFGYRVSVSGSEAAPDNSTRWEAGAAPGFTLIPAYGQSTTLRGQLMPSFRAIGLPFTSATVEASSDGTQWSNLAAIDMPSGVGYATVSPLALTYYRFRFSGNGSYASSVSSVVAVTPDATGPTTATKAAQGKKGRPITLKYRIDDNLSAKATAVRLTIKNSRKKVVKKFSLGTQATGTWLSVKWKPRAKGSYSYRVTAKDLAGNAQSKARSAKIRVN